MPNVLYQVYMHMKQQESMLLLLGGDMNFLLKIMQGTALVGTILAATAEIAARLKTQLELDPDFSVNVISLTTEAIKVDDDTMAVINTWREAKGLGPLTPQLS